MSADSRLIVALDYPDADAARRLVEALSGSVAHFKIGLTLLADGGMGLAADLKAEGLQIFQDWKLHDIGAQVEGAARGIAATGAADLLTVHAEPQVMRAAVAGRGAATTRLLGVTVLTSLSDPDLTEMGYGFKAADLVERRVRQALDCGLDGVVSSPREAALVRRIVDDAGRADFLIVTPGVRPSGSSADDQQRTATPAGALKAGATHLVVGRPITAAADPRAAALAILDEMAGA